MTRIVELDRIKELLGGVDVLAAMEAGFLAYAQGRAVVPPVGELAFADPPGETHIKYGYISGEAYFVIKIASGFYQNPALGLSSSQGVMLVFSQRTGSLEAVLLDEGYLTDVRTAAAGAVVAKYMAPKEVTRIGVLGAGIQARMQLAHLRGIVACDRALVWARNQQREDEMRRALPHLEIAFTRDPAEVGTCNFIITTTPSTTPLLRLCDVSPGTHITAMGSDTPEKVELDPALVGRANWVVADSLPQSEQRGEVFQAVRAGTLARERVLALGDIIASGQPIQREVDDISVADLTGVAVQDIQIATAVLQEL